MNYNRNIKMWQVLRRIRMGKNKECRGHGDEIKNWVFCKNARAKGG